MATLTFAATDFSGDIDVGRFRAELDAAEPGLVLGVARDIDPSVPKDDVIVETSRTPTAGELTTINNTITAHTGTKADPVSLAAGTVVGELGYASDGRKVGERPGAGTGIPVWWDGTNWRRLRDDVVATS